MKALLVWIAVPLLLLAAVMLVAGIGTAGLWIAVVAVGIALVVIGQVKPSAPRQRRRARSSNAAGQGQPNRPGQHNQRLAAHRGRSPPRRDRLPAAVPVRHDRQTVGPGR
jgi:hypothetical protein